MAEPTAPAIISTVTSGAPCWMMPRPLAAPMNEVAPTWPATAPTWIETMTPIGMATSSVGAAATLAMNAHWRMNSSNGNRRRKMATTSSVTACAPIVI